MARLAVLGASGGVGRRLVELALAEGHAVTAAVRDPAKVSIRHERLRIVCCDVLDPSSIAPAVAAQDALLCTLGSSDRGPTLLYSTGARNVVAEMRVQHVRRLVFLSNFGVLDETARGLHQRLLLSIVQRALRHTIADHRRAIDVMRQSGLEWIAVRPLPMTDGPHTGSFRVTVEDLPPKGVCISRCDVAAFMLGQIESCDYVRSLPALAY